MRDQKELKQKYADILAAEVWHGDKKMVDFCVKEAAYIVELDNGDIIPIKKPRIEKDFCFGYSDSRYNTDDYDRANNMAAHAKSSESYFLEKNLAGIDETIAILEGDAKKHWEYYISIPYSGQPENSQLKHVFADYWHSDRVQNKPKLEGADRQKVIEGYKIVRAAFEKRLHSYLKRYGMSKVRAWSYWQDA